MEYTPHDTVHVKAVVGDAAHKPNLALVNSNGHVNRNGKSRQVFAVKASTIKPKRTRWLWDSRVPLGEIAILGGREGIGKSTVCYQIVADITRGKLRGEFFGKCRNIIIAATEDSWAYTIVPRLMAAGADLDRVYQVGVSINMNSINGVNDVDGKSFGDNVVESELSMPDDLVSLRKLVIELDVALILLDPLMSRLDSKLDTHKDADVRRALEPVAKLAHECSVSVLGIIHVNKSGSNDPLTLIMGSKAFAAVSRAVLFCMIDPEDESEQRRLLGQPKNNLGTTDLPTLVFKINDTLVCQTDDGDIHTGKIVWLDDVKSKLNDMIEISKQGIEDRTKTVEAKTWLEDYLNSAGEPVASEIVKVDGKKAGYSLSTLRRALIKLSGIVDSEAVFPRRTYWSLPSR